MVFKNADIFSLLMKKTFTVEGKLIRLIIVEIASNCEYFQFFHFRDLGFLFAYFWEK